MKLIDPTLVKKFRIRLIECDMTIKEFTISQGIDYGMFTAAINGHTNCRDSYTEAIEEFLKEQ